MKNPDGSYESKVPYEEARVGAAALYCSDGRVGDQMDDFLHDGLGLPRYDRVACPGGPVSLAGHLAALWESRGVEEQLRFLIRAHALRRVVLIAHEGCAYYRERLRIPPALVEEQQLKDLDLAAWAVRRMESALTIQAFFARVSKARISFEPATLSLAGPE